MKSGMLSASCTDCHAMKVVRDMESLGDGAGAGYPTLTGYAGREWLKDFIRNPAHADFYDSHNLMLAFGEQVLSETDLDLLVNWMTGAYYMPPNGN